MNKKLLIITIILALGAALAAGFYYLSNPSPDSGTQEEKPFTLEKKDLSPSQLPKGFPKEFPVEKGSEVIGNYEATTSDGRTQSTRVVTTKQSLEQAKSVYQKFFVGLGWTDISTKSPDSDTVTALLRRGDDVVLITARNNTATKQRTVEVTLTEAADSNQ